MFGYLRTKTRRDKLIIIRHIVNALWLSAGERFEYRYSGKLHSSSQNGTVMSLNINNNILFYAMPYGNLGRTLLRD